MLPPPNPPRVLRVLKPGDIAVGAHEGIPFGWITLNRKWDYCPFRTPSADVITEARGIGFAVYLALEALPLIIISLKTSSPTESLRPFDRNEGGAAHGTLSIDPHNEIRSRGNE